MKIRKTSQRSLANLILVLCSSLFFSSPLFADSATLDGTTLVIPHVKAFNSYYSVTLEKSSDSLPASFNFVELAETTYIEGVSGVLANYSSTRNELDIPSVVIDGKIYHMTLAGGATAESYVIKSFGLNVPDFLFMINAGAVTFANSGSYAGQEFAQHFAIDVSAAVQVFSDRPFRIAHALNGGLSGFVDAYAGSDFSTDSPNTTFAGTDESGELIATVFELGLPVVIGDNVIFPVTRFIGTEPALQEGTYTASNLVVDNFWDVLEVIGAGIATVAACTVGEVASGGADTAVCGAAVVATTGLIGGKLDK